MTLARLLAAAPLLCSLLAFAQDQQSQSSPSLLPVSVHSTRDVILGEPFLFPPKLTYSPAASEPWQIFPNSPANLVPGPTRPDQIPAHQPKLEFRVRQLLESQLDRLRQDGPTCYAIRSYVVARDSKDSDSTHPASYSTCQPATRYGLKTTEIRSTMPDR